MAWFYLILAGLLEVGFAMCLGASKNFTRIPFVIGFFVFAIFSFTLLGQALKTIPVGTAYAVWTGIGAAGTALLGILFLGEAATPARLFFLVMLIVSVAGLKFVSGH